MGIVQPSKHKPESNMTNFQVSNSKSGISFGLYDANNPEAAIEMACKDAGYSSKDDAEDVMGHDCELIAVPA
jgi:hypothetical protein